MKISSIFSIQKAPRRVRSARNKIASGTRITVGAAISIGFLLPIVWMLTGSLKDEQSVTAIPPKLIPNPIHFGNYVDAVRYIAFGTYLRNSVVVTAFTVFATLLVCVPSGYAFSILRWRGRSAAFSFVLFGMMLPFPAVMIPIYILFRKMGMIGNLSPLLVPPLFGQFVTPAFSSALAIFLLRQFLTQLPYELVEAAKIDGAGSLRILLQILIPLAKPVLITITIMTALSSWTACVGPLIYINSDSLSTLSLGLQHYQSQHFTAYNLLLAASTLYVLPVLILFFVAQKYFTAGATRGAVK